MSADQSSPARGHFSTRSTHGGNPARGRLCRRGVPRRAGRQHLPGDQPDRQVGDRAGRRRRVEDLEDAIASARGFADTSDWGNGDFRKRCMLQFQDGLRAQTG